MSSTASKVALAKQQRPENYCKASRCLWRVLVHDAAGKLVPAKGCSLTGYCPRHKHLAQDLPGVVIERSF